MYSQQFGLLFEVLDCSQNLGQLGGNIGYSFTLAWSDRFTKLLLLIRSQAIFRTVQDTMYGLKTYVVGYLEQQQSVYFN